MYVDQFPYKFIYLLDSGLVDAWIPPSGSPHFFGRLLSGIASLHPNISLPNILLWEIGIIIQHILQQLAVFRMAIFTSSYKINIYRLQCLVDAWIPPSGSAHFFGQLLSGIASLHRRHTIHAFFLQFFFAFSYLQKKSPQLLSRMTSLPSSCCCCDTIYTFFPKSDHQPFFLGNIISVRNAHSPHNF